MNKQQQEQAETLDLMERYEMTLRYHGQAEKADQVLADRLDLRAELLTELRADNQQQVACAA